MVSRGYIQQKLIPVIVMLMVLTALRQDGHV
jgi:hypothetical protein